MIKYSAECKLTDMTSLSSAMARVQKTHLFLVKDNINMCFVMETQIPICIFKTPLDLVLCTGPILVEIKLRLKRTLISELFCCSSHDVWLHLLLAAEWTHSPNNSAPSWRKSVFLSAARSPKQCCRLNNDERLLPSDCFMIYALVKSKGPMASLK